MSESKLQLEAELITIHFQSMLVRWGQSAPIRTGLHASAVLVSDAEWCVREHVLHEIYPDRAIAEALHTWDWKRSAIFENGWRLHQRWQDVFKKFAKVVYEHVVDEEGYAITEWELDRTHFDVTRNIYFSPDAIIEFAGQRYLVEIKGIKQEAYQELTDDLMHATLVNETVAKARVQANLYMHLLGLKKAVLLIENKNDQSFKVWVIEYDRELSVKYIQRIYYVKGNALNTRTFGLNKLAPRICHSRGDQRAKVCPMRDVCFSKEMEG
jgi:hypothetical protein